MPRYALLLALLLVSVPALSWSQGSAKRPPIEVTVKPLDPRTDDSAIEVLIVITNKSARAIELRSLGGHDPFFLRIVDERGLDLDLRFLRPVSTNWSTPDNVLHLDPSETKELIRKVTTVKDEKGEDKRLGPGTYGISIELPLPADEEDGTRGMIKTQLIRVTTK